jgi:ATP-dependent RNA helicase DeaD
VHNVEVNEAQIEQYLQRIYDEFADLSKEEVIKRFASLEFNRFLNYYKNAPDLNVKGDDRGSDRNSMREGKSGNHTRLFINLGSVDEFSRGDLLRFICDKSGINGTAIGRIDIKGVYSFFEVENDVLAEVQEGFKSVEFNGRGVRIEIAGASEGGGGERRERSSSRPRSSGGERKSYGGGAGRSTRERSSGSSYSSGGGAGRKSYGSGGAGKGSSDRKKDSRGGRW